MFRSLRGHHKITIYKLNSFYEGQVIIIYLISPNTSSCLIIRLSNVVIMLIAYNKPD